VGNISTGGVGKTPMVIWLAERLVEMGRRPAVVSRGYKSRAGEFNEEMQLVSRRVPAAVCISNPHRVAAAAFAVEEQGADAIVLDDGFQHRALWRDLDIVLIDARSPFGHGHVLPRGLLREPLHGLRRADVIVLTRCDQVGVAEVDDITREVRRHAAEAPLLRCVHRVSALLDVDGKPSDAPVAPGRPALCFAALGNPQAFAETCRRLGYNIVGRVWWPDHHHYSPADVREVMQRARAAGAEVLLSTEKDAIKLARLSVEWSPPLRIVRVDIDFWEEGRTILLGAVQTALDTFEPPDDGQIIPAD
jgi:tetraacyldisaccharide 4'-kinase